MSVTSEQVSYEGKTYTALCIEGDTGNQNTNWSDWWAASCYDNGGGLLDFMKTGDNIKFKCIGDGKVYRMTLRMVGSEYKDSTYYIYEFGTKSGQAIDVVIPYSKFRLDASSPKKYKFDKNNITAVEFFAYNPGRKTTRSLKIFDVRVY